MKPEVTSHLQTPIASVRDVLYTALHSAHLNTGTTAINETATEKNLYLSHTGGGGL